jgi:hypothetical protein
MQVQILSILNHCVVGIFVPSFETFGQFLQTLVLTIAYMMGGHPNAVLDDRLLQIYVSHCKILEVHGVM